MGRCTNAGSITKAELDRYFTAEQERLASARRADDLKEKNEPLKKRLIDFVLARGGADRTTVHHGYVLSLKSRAGTPGYKEAFLQLATPDAAEDLRKNAQPTTSLSIERAAG